MLAVDVSAGPIEYRDTGGEGPVIVLLHGLVMDSLLWRNVVPELTGNFRCILPTLPLGAHRLPMHPDADLTLRGQGRIIAEFLDRLDLDEVTLCFSDWSGAQVMIADQLVERVARLVLISCEAFENYPPGIPGRMAWLSAKTPGGMTAMRMALRMRAVRHLPFVFGSMSKKRVPDEVMLEWLRPLKQRDIRRDLSKYAGAAMRGRKDLLAATSALPSFQRPVLVVWASEDRIMPLEHGERLVDLFPNSRLVEIPDSYTLVSEDQPTLLASCLLEFLDELAEAAA